MRAKVFISYRRDDARADARSIFQRLQRSFGSDQLFMDVDSIPRGSDFRVLLDRYLKQCKVMLVVIGQGWLDARDENGKRRIEDPADFVRVELAMALARKIAVIPVLVDGARLPKQDELPADLKPLVFRQSASLRHETFARDMDVLEKDIGRLIEPAVRPAVAAPWLVLLALAVAGWWQWPQIRAWLAQQGTTEVTATTQPVTYGVQSPRIAEWQKQVRPVSIKVEESPHIGRPVRLADRIRVLSKGQIELIIEPRGTASPTDRLEALSKGTIDAVWDHPSVWWQRSAAFPLYNGYAPLGLDNRRHARWLSDRGLRELNQATRDRLGLNVTAMPCYINPPEGFWLRKSISSVADLKGLTIRAPEFFFWRLAPTLGLKPVSLSAADFTQALHKGALDGGEHAWPQVDFDQGLGKQGLHYYYPGFHSPALTSYLFFNTDRWNALPAATRGLLEEACRAQVESDLQTSDQRAQAGLVRLKTRGVEVHTFSPDVLAAVDRAMRELTDEIAARDPDFKAAWASYNAYR